MTAADRAAWRERIEALSPLLSRFNIALVVVVVALAWAFYVGKAKGVQQEKDKAYAIAHAALVDSIRAIEARLSARARVLAKADTAATVARAAHAKAASRIAVLTDSTVSIDNGPPVREVPASLVVPEIRTCTQAIAADTLDTTLLRQQLADMTKDRDEQRARAELDEAHVVKPSRFGLRTGLALGAGGVLAVLHFLK